MRFSSGVAEMVNGLNTVTRAIATRATLPVLEGVLLTTCPEGVRMTCTDIALGVETCVDAIIEEEGGVVLPGKLLAEIMRKLPLEGRVDLRVSEANVATIRAPGSRTTLSGTPSEEYPALPEVGEAKAIQMAQRTLRNMIQKTSFAISTDESRPILTGCLIESDGREMHIVALDGFRLALYRQVFEEVIPTLTAVVPGKVLNELAKLLEDSEDPVTFLLGKSHLMVDLGATRIIARLLEGEFIKYEQILPKDWLTRVRVSKRDVEAAIERASLMAREGKNNLVKLHIEGENILITSNAELGDVREEVNAACEGKPLDIAFNVRYLSDTLRAIDDEEIIIRFNSNVSPCVICPLEGEQYIYLALPVRVYSA